MSFDNTSNNTSDDTKSDDANSVPARFVRPRRGRPKKLTEELIETWAELLPVCLYIDSAAKIIGISKACIWAWLERGRIADEKAAYEESDLCIEGELLYLEFFRATQTALARGEVLDVAGIVRAGRNGDWRAAAWRLERRFPDRYSSLARDLKLAEKELVELRAKTDLFKSREMELADVKADNARLRAELEAALSGKGWMPNG